MKLRYRMTLDRRKAWMSALMITPWLVGMLTLVAWPLVDSFRVSLNRVEGIRGLRRIPIGINNYQEALFADPDVPEVLIETIVGTIVDIPVILVFSMIVGYLLQGRYPGRGLFRATFFLPVIIGSGLVMREIFVQDTSVTAMFSGARDIAEQLLIYLGPTVAQLFLATIERLTMVLWQSGVQIILVIAGLESIPVSYYEAGKVDGAGAWEMFWRVTLPLMTPILLVAIVYTIVDSFSSVNNQIMVFIRETMFTGTMRFGYSSAVAWLYFMMILLLVGVVLWSSKKWAFYAGER